MRKSEVKLINSFSLQMLDSFPASVDFEEIGEREFNDLRPFLKSAIGHTDTATVLGVQANRISIGLKPGEEFIVAQLQGGRLPEGTTSLPNGFSFRFFKGKVSQKEKVMD